MKSLLIKRERMLRMDKCKVEIRPLSVNAAWKGRRFKTPEYTQYENDMQILLPQVSQPWNEPIRMTYTFKLRRASTTDVDNLIKPLQDILVRTGIIADDNLIQSFTATKQKDNIDSVEVTIEPYADN